MTLKSAAHDARGEHRFRFDENVRGALIVALGAVGLIGLSWGMMVVLTSPNGWVTKAANSAIAGEQVQLVSFADSGD